MKNSVYKSIELTGTSTKSIEEAVTKVIHRAKQTVKHLAWLQVLEMRDTLLKGEIHQWQVTIKVGFAPEI